MEGGKGLGQQHHGERRQEVEGDAGGTEEAGIWLQLVHPLQALGGVPDRPVVFSQRKENQNQKQR